MTLYDCSRKQNAAQGIAAAVRALHAGELVVMPTDTVYGIACDAFNAEAIEKLLAAKGRGPDMPVPVLVSAWEDAAKLAGDMPNGALQLARHYWPGGLSIVVPQARDLSWNLGHTHDTVMLRMPNSALARKLLSRTGPLGVSSANKTGHAPATTAQQAWEQLHTDIAVYLDDGPAAVGKPSTIVDFTQDEPRILREGALTAQQVWEILEKENGDTL
ncbi:MAG: L-threonylcarbamoyladenylate synthase [Lawsonella sp.]|nr:threonylcarbamoyl-AMP synthase [Mycobacteriales bacterium]